MAPMPEQEKVLLWVLWQNFLSPINLHRGKHQEAISAGTKHECLLAGVSQRRRQHEAPSVLHFSSFFWGRSLAGLWQQPQIRKWWSIMDSSHSPIHAPGCSVDYKKSCVRSFIFYLLSPNSFLITFHMSHMCVRLPVWDPLTAHCASENVTCQRLQTSGGVNTGSSSKTNSVSQARLSIPAAVWADLMSNAVDIQYTWKCRFSPRGGVPPVPHLGTHENGNGSSWSEVWDQSVYSSGLLIKVKRCLLDPVLLPDPCYKMTLRCNSAQF